MHSMPEPGPTGLRDPANVGMEAILRHVPRSFTDQTLRKELDPLMKSLGIVNYACDKPRRKTHAWVSFLDKADGIRFIYRHGKHPAGTSQAHMPTGRVSSESHVKAYQGYQAYQNVGSSVSQRDIPNLYITGQPIYVELSYRLPNKHELSHLELEKAKFERRRTTERDPKIKSQIFQVQWIACGNNTHIGQQKQLAFASQTALQVPTMSTARLTQRSLTITVSASFRINIPADTIVDFIAGRNDGTLTVVLSEPPRFYAVLSDDPDARIKWERRECCPTWDNHRAYVAHHLVYRFLVAGSASSFDNIIRAIETKDLVSITQDNLPVVDSPLHHERHNDTHMMAFEQKISNNHAGRIRLPYPLLFQIQALVFNNYLRPSEGLRLFEEMETVYKKAQDSNHPVPFNVESLRKLFQRIPYRCPGVDASAIDPTELVRAMMEHERTLRQSNILRDKVYGTSLPNHQAWVLKAMVTPTRIFLHGPEAESKNRILRKHSNHIDYFIRCLFCDEDGQDLPFNPGVSNDPIYDRFSKILHEGFSIAGRKYAFLGFSHSSLRSHSAWFVAPFMDDNYEHHTAETIIRSLGRFDDIRVPAKCAARIGQAFSETPYAVPIFDLGIQTQSIPDVTSTDGSRVFSDGVGTISYSAMEEFWAKLPERAMAATCFQIRWGGCKGMLSLDTDLNGKAFCVRPSMRKFTSDDLMELGICDTASRPLELKLNRQMIKILEDMGTDDAWFLELQHKAIETLRGVTADAKNTSSFLKHQRIGFNAKFPHFIRELNNMGIDYRQDKFLKTVVEHVVLRELRLLKHKARIPVEHGVTLFGVMDTTGFLEEGEVYFTFDESRNFTLPPFGSRILITRSPASHPGDIRIVKLIEPPFGSSLTDLTNCVVFSQKGERDLPSQLSGGDLDGDLYNLIWDPWAMPMSEHAPADYPRVTPMPLSRPVTREDIADFFINFMKTDVLGMIATRHQIMADVADRGTLDDKCIRLAELHSTSVDSSKTGIAVDVKTMPKAPRTRPDFLAVVPPLKTYDIGQVDHIANGEESEEDEEDGMGVAKHRYHRSQKILGKLYRNIDERRIWAEGFSGAHVPTTVSVWDQLMHHVKCELAHLGKSADYSLQMEEAWKIRGLYENSVEDMMWQFSDNHRKPIREVEVFCGSILNKRGSQTRRQQDSSIKLAEENDRVQSWIVGMICDGEGKSQHHVLKLCMACLEVGGESNPPPGADWYQSDDRLLSFRVLAACCVVRELQSFSAVISNSHDSYGGGFVGVSGPRREMALPLR